MTCVTPQSQWHVGSGTGPSATQSSWVASLTLSPQWHNRKYSFPPFSSFDHSCSVSEFDSVLHPSHHTPLSLSLSLSFSLSVSVSVYVGLGREGRERSRMEPEMGEATSRVSPALHYQQQPQHTAGIVKKIRLENFMCHSNFEMEFGDAVNFILGQNGSQSLSLISLLSISC